MNLRSKVSFTQTTQTSKTITSTIKIKSSRKPQSSPAVNTVKLQHLKI